MLNPNLDWINKMNGNGEKEGLRNYSGCLLSYNLNTNHV